MPHGESFLRSLAELDAALDENVARAKLMKRRIAQIQRERAAGKSYRDIIDTGSEPLLVRLLTESTRALHESGARVRRNEARALHEEGMTMDQIAEKFGVTRQRISGLLKDAHKDPR